MLLDGAADRDAFRAYIKQVLVPTLRPGQIVILDNLSVQKQPALERAIEAAGCEVRFLPTYSPDVNLIEQAFAKIKQLVQYAEARTTEAPEAALADALDRVTQTDARGSFRGRGYSAL